MTGKNSATQQKHCRRHQGHTRLTSLGIDGDDSDGSALAFKVGFRPFHGRGGTKRYKLCYPVASAARGAGGKCGPSYQTQPTFICGPAERTRSCCSTSPTLSGSEGSLGFASLGCSFTGQKSVTENLNPRPPSLGGLLGSVPKGRPRLRSERNLNPRPPSLGGLLGSVPKGRPRLRSERNLNPSHCSFIKKIKRTHP
jgi:hypothetical protein